ncbi:MAG: undecaprenyldiphospho-muramoylpentapeptide beta-N-acetylglucosaminyltransferase [Deltaproteobacteria bacterium]|nr:undecaprenyldiphospho-muramoylpentapeptide beta-N-acetylglucosaminyltransferase [Deltaproteobacteria bacterium]
MRLIIAGGGTGGHLYPGIALAEEFRARGGEVLFVGTERGIEVRAVPKAGFPLELINVTGLKRMGVVKTLLSLGRLPGSFLQAQGIIRKFQPDVVVGVGGYASGPMVLTARLLGLVTAVLEQNSIPGMTNKVLGRFVQRVYGQFEANRPFFPAGRFERAGNPIRASIAAKAGAQGTGILVLGGSQGAKALNDKVPGALAAAFKGTPPIPVLHQTGEKHVEDTTRAYADAGVQAEVSAFIDDMGAAYAAARLCICRAGATTVAELTALGKPAVFIPFPFAADDHQTFNAREMQDAGAAVLCAEKDLTAETLGNTVRDLLETPGKLELMADKARALGRPRAAQEIADALAALVTGAGATAPTGVQP